MKSDGIGPVGSPNFAASQEAAVVLLQATSGAPLVVPGGVWLLRAEFVRQGSDLILFGKFVPEAVAAKLISDEGALKPQTTEATILFTDLAGFTALSESLEPPGIVDTLNDFFSAAAEIIERHQGVITQFQGDAILAIFNIPVADADHALHAVEAAVEIHRMMDRRTFNGHRLRCRIGVNTGRVVAGNVGAEERMNYTVHGDDVNLAARLEALNKEHGTVILVSSSTADRVSGVSFQPIGELEIRGKSAKVTVLTVAEM